MTTPESSTTPAPAEPSKIAAAVDQRRKRQGEEIKSWFEQLASPDAQEFARLPEAVFVNNFLPFFAGQTVPAHINAAAWISIAGTPYKSVHVVGAEQEVLYTVPPLFDREATKPDMHNRQTSTMSHVMTTYQQLLNIHPARAQHYLENEFDKRQLMQNIPGAVINHLKVWNEIFTRYGIPLIAPTPAGAETQTDGGKAELDYSDDIL